MAGRCELNKHWHEVTCSSWRCSTSSFRQASTAFHCAANWRRQRQGSRHLSRWSPTSVSRPLVTCAPWSPVTLFSVHEILIGDKYAFFPNASDEPRADTETWTDVIPVGILSVPLPLSLCTRSPESHFSVGLPLSYCTSCLFITLCLFSLLLKCFQSCLFPCQVNFIHTAQNHRSQASQSVEHTASILRPLLA